MDFVTVIAGDSLTRYVHAHPFFADGVKGSEPTGSGPFSYVPVRVGLHQVS